MMDSHRVWGPPVDHERVVTDGGRDVAADLSASQWLDAIMASPLSVVALLDPEGRIRRMNQQSLAFLDADASSVRGTRLWELDGVNNSHVTTARIRDAVETAIAGDTTTVELDVATNGDQFVVETVVKPVTGGDGVAGLLVVGHDVTERQEREREAREARQRMETTLERVDEGFFALDDDWRFTYLNRRAETILDRSAQSLLGERIWEQFPDAVGSAFYDEYQRAMRTQESTTFEARYDPLDAWFEVSAYPSPDGLSVYFRDVTDQKRRDEALSGLLETTRALMQARTRDEVAQIIATAAKKTLGFDLNVVRVYDSETETLVPVGSTDEAVETMHERPAYALEEGPPGEVFATGEPQRYDDVRDIDDDVDRDPIRAAMYLPIGVHGTISIGATEPNAFDEVDQQIAEILATNAATAFSRAKREADVRRARERIERMVERINGLVQNTVEVLVQGTTREEIERGVTQTLAAADPYVFAWIGTRDVVGETFAPSEWAGDVDLPIDEYEVHLADVDGGDPSVRAATTREMQIVQDLPDDPFHAAVAAAGIEAIVAVPLVYKDTIYGVLTGYADEVDAVDEREQVVLEALGRGIANAINAVESGRILSSDRVIELELSIGDEALLFSRLSGRADCEITSTGSIYEIDGKLRLFVTVEDCDPATIADLLAADDDVVSQRHVVTHEAESLFEVTVEDSLIQLLADFGAVTKRVAGADGVSRIAIELPYEAEAREIFELVADQYAAVELVGYHEHDRPVETRQEFRAALRDRFTERQETALRSAYLGGFFEWPREVDGDELAAAMDITRPTYHQHLRTAERKVFEELFESS